MTTIANDAAHQALRRSGRRVALVIAVVAVIVAVGAGAWTTWPKPSGHRRIYSETLSDGRVFQCFSDGAFIGSAGSTVETRKAPGAVDGSAGGPALVVRPPDYTEDEARSAGEAYRNSGRTPEHDMADFDRLSAECRQRR